METSGFKVAASPTVLWSVFAAPFSNSLWTD